MFTFDSTFVFEVQPNPSTLFSQVYSKQKACERREKQVNLEKKIEEMESNLSENFAPEEILEYKNVKAQLDDLYNYITEEEYSEVKLGGMKRVRSQQNSS